MTYSTVAGHRAMVFDGVRNAAYFRAIKKSIDPTTTVMDLGAGLGIHGLNAASLGAAAVHMVEPATVLELVRKVASDNVLNNIYYHSCRVEELSLNERVDVLISVFTGNFLLTEDLLPSLFYARDNFLKPGGQMIPDRARMEVMPVSAGHYYGEHIDRWSNYPEHAGNHGEPLLDYKSVRAFATNSLYHDSLENFMTTSLAAPAPLMELDLATATSADCNTKVEVEITQSGTCHGWLGWFQIHLGSEWLSTFGKPDNTHWRPVFLPLETPLEVTAGEKLFFSLKRPEFGEWTWVTRQAERKQRQSTFLSGPLTPERMRKMSDSYQPALNNRGEAAKWLLMQMTGKYSSRQLAARLCEEYPGFFVAEADALSFVKDQAERFS